MLKGREITGLLLLQQLGLYFSYVYFVHAIFFAEGYELDFQIGRWLQVNSLIVACAIITTYSKLLLVQWFSILTMMLYVGPLAVFLTFNSDKDLSVLFSSTLALMVVNFVAPLIKLNLSRSTFKNSELLCVLLALIIIAVVALRISALGVQLNLDLGAVYEFREDNGARINRGIFAYINAWTYNILMPIVIAISLARQKFASALVLVFLQVFFFATTSHKAVLIYPAVVGFFWFFRRKRASILFLSSFCFLPFLFMILHLVTSEILLPSIFIRRLLFVPVLISSNYIEFFQFNDFLIWSNSVLSWLHPYNYDVPIQKVIGLYMNREDIWANVGFIPSGYAHLGTFGVLFYSIILGGSLGILTTTAKDFYPEWFLLGVLTIPFSTVISSSDLFTSFLSHGLGLAILLFWLMRSPGLASVDEKRRV